MDTKDVALFLAIARIGSISHTAEQMFMSQSTVTTRLQRLERAVGYTLFERGTGGVQLTAAGEQFLPLAERMCSMETDMLLQGRTQTPLLRVMSGRAFVSTDVPLCLSQMMREHSVRLQVRMGLYNEMKEALLARQVDFCFLGEPIYHPHIVQVEYPPDLIDLIVPADHRFVRHFPGLAALHNEPFIAFAREDAPFRKRVTGCLAQAGVYPNIRMELDSIDGIKAMVGHGLGVSCLPRRTLHDAGQKGFVSLPLPFPGFQRPTLIAYPDAIAALPLTRQFLAVAAAVYRRFASK